MPRAVRAIFGLVLGYAIGVAAGIALVALLSGNVHDRSVETAMTAAFVTGPLGAVIGAIAALLRSGKSAGGN